MYQSANDCWLPEFLETFLFMKYWDLTDSRLQAVDFSDGQSGFEHEFSKTDGVQYNLVLCKAWSQIETIAK